ncbi:hypothetical protein RAC89_05330 [Paenibacillus sp. GD4]|jgi:hypothetical protein|nr:MULTISPECIES: hypothetical protein [Paenibacillus]MDQ1909915.1 hypothetical protein [Paenibacillus sp. GD4]
MAKTKGKSMKQKNQAMAAESSNATENITGSTQPTYHAGAHEQNNRSV